MSKYKSNKWFSLALALGLIFTGSASFAQDEEGNVYDPFIDYSEFEEAGEEEADINFFRNGRLFTAGLAVGQRTFTEGMSDIFENNITFGLFLSYFFDLRWALQFSYMAGNHAFKVGSKVGDAEVSHVAIDMKYYFNTQNVTKGLAAFNPYVLGGVSFVTRDTSSVGVVEIGNDDARGLDVAFGVEIPVGRRNAMYVGAQALFQLVSFKDESTELTDAGVATGLFPNGDFLTLSAVLGLNF